MRNTSFPFLNRFISKISLSNSHRLLILVLIAWVSLAVVYINNTTDLRYQYDVKGHIDYTMRIFNDHKLPSPYDGWETYHPPLFYLINQILSPDSANHNNYVRYSSIFFGLIFLLCCIRFMAIFKVKVYIQTLLVLYFSTLPSFFALFTSYNNDALAISLSALMMLLAYSYWLRPKKLFIFSLIITSTLGFYTKYSIFYAYFFILILSAIRYLISKENKQRLLAIIFSLVVAGLLFFPWTYLNNYKKTEKFFPNNFENGYSWDEREIKKTVGLANFYSPLKITQKDWQTPYVMNSNLTFQKKNFFELIIANSLFGEFPYSGLLKLSIFSAWVITICYMFLWIILAIKNRKQNLFILSSILLFYVLNGLQILYSPRYSTSHFRYYAAVVLPLMVFSSLVLSNIDGRYSKLTLNISLILLILGSCANLFFLYCILLT